MVNGTMAPFANEYAPETVGHLRRLRRRPEYAIPLAVSLAAAIATADHLMGYELRLAILYFLPIALASWECGRRWGLLVVGLGPLAWAVSFSKQHTYSRNIYFYGDCLAMAATLVVPGAENLDRLTCTTVESGTVPTLKAGRRFISSRGAAKHDS